jgi:hypothetical protein
LFKLLGEIGLFRICLFKLLGEIGLFRICLFKLLGEIGLFRVGFDNLVLKVFDSRFLLLCVFLTLFLKSLRLLFNLFDLQLKSCNSSFLLVGLSFGCLQLLL